MLCRFIQRELLYYQLHYVYLAAKVTIGTQEIDIKPTNNELLYIT